MTARPLAAALLLAATLAAAAPARAHGPEHGHGHGPATAADAVPEAAAADPLAGRFGGPFELVDTDGRTVTDRDFRGRFLLIYFGYTHCVDVCPVDLAVQGQAIEALGADAARVAHVFVTVDPARDTPQVLAGFLESFRPGTIGLTGSEAQVRRIAAAYRVHRRPVALDHPDAEHLRDAAGAYIVDHGSLTFLMDPEGRFATLIPHGADAARMAAIIARYVHAQSRPD